MSSRGRGRIGLAAECHEFMGLVAVVVVVEGHHHQSSPHGSRQPMRGRPRRARITYPQARAMLIGDWGTPKPPQCRKGKWVAGAALLIADVSTG